MAGQGGIRQEKRLRMVEQINEVMERNHGVAKASDLREIGMDYRRLESFVQEGTIRRVRNGYYQMARVRVPEEEVILALFPDGVLTMQTALYYYKYLPARPMCWSIAIDKNTSKSRFSMDHPAVTPFYTEPKVLSLGVQEIDLGGGNRMKIYDRDRLICDCLKYEEKLEHEELRRALLGYLADRGKDYARLLEYAKARKVVRKVRDRIGVWL